MEQGVVDRLASVLLVASRHDHGWLIIGRPLLSLNHVTILVKFLIKHLHVHDWFDLLLSSSHWTLLVCKFSLSLLYSFLLERHLGLMVKPVVDSFLTALTSRLGIHQNGVSWVLGFGDLASDVFLALSLTLFESHLVSEELLLRSTLLSLTLNSLRLEVAIFNLFRVVLLLNALFFQLADSLALPG